MSEPMLGQDNSDQVAYWNDKAGATWAAFQPRIDAAFSAITAAAIDAAAPQPGERVIDVGCGCGETVLALARRVGPAGQVLGVDISAPMLARARERIGGACLANAEVIQSDASAHPFAGAADLLFSRFGVMFFADPVAAFANLRRAVRPGGRMLFAAWRPMVENLWSALPLQATADLFAPQPPSDPLAPGPFAFADEARVRTMLAASGWQGVELRHIRPDLCISEPGHPEQAAEFATRVGALARLLGEADEATRARARQAVAAALAPYDGPAGVVLAGSVWLVSARA